MTDGMGLSWVWAVGLITFAFGIATGVGIAYAFFGSGKRTKELRDELDNLQQQFDDYRNQVGTHFLRSSELVQKMTDSYRDVYEHLASGSQALCQKPVSTPRLDIPGTPMLDSEKKKPEPDSTPVPTNADAYSDAETDNLNDAASDDFLGDSPNVPKLDTEEAEPGVSRQPPLQ